MPASMPYWPPFFAAPGTPAHQVKTKPPPSNHSPDSGTTYGPFPTHPTCRSELLPTTTQTDPSSPDTTKPTEWSSATNGPFAGNHATFAGHPLTLLWHPDDGWTAT